MKSIKKYMKTDYHFDKPMMGAILSALWAFSGIYGFLYEFIFYYLNSGCKTWYWRGGCFGPWIVIYGIGSLAIFFMTYRFKKKPWLVVLLSGLVCGALEGGVGAFFYYCMDGKRNWDYNTEILNFGNIGGFVCLRSVLIFAISGLMLIYVIVPILFFLAGKMNRRVFMTIGYVIGILFLVDVLYNTVIAEHIPGLFNAVSFYESKGFNFMQF